MIVNELIKCMHPLFIYILYSILNFLVHKDHPNFAFCCGTVDSSVSSFSGGLSKMKSLFSMGRKKYCDASIQSEAESERQNINKQRSIWFHRKHDV